LEAFGAARTVDSLLHTVVMGSERLSTIVKALKSYSFLDQAPLQEIDVTAGIDDTLLILGARLSGIRVERDYEPGLATIEAHGSELNQVWTNLIANAADAIEEANEAGGEGSAGRITISAHNSGTGVVVEVTDDGPGIPPEIMDRIFDSFFTTKEPGKGTGMGLDISHQIVVRGHHGELSVDSEPGRTTFRVALPTNSSGYGESAV
jgi:signal transduction histidine kinase